MPSEQNAVAPQSPTPSAGNPEGSDLRSVAGQIEGLLDGDGHYNPGGQKSREPNEMDAPASGRGRDEQGRFKAQETDDLVDDPDDTGTGQLADDGDPEADQDVSASQNTDDEADVDTDDAIQTLAQLAEVMEIPLEELTSELTHTFKAAGEEHTVNLAELVAGYQKDADYRKSTAQLADERRAAQAEEQTRLQTYEMQNQMLAQQFNAAEQLIAYELNDPRLAELRETDPAEWTARREEIGQRIGALQQARQQAAVQYEQFMSANFAQQKEREMASLQQAVPDWSDDSRNTVRDVMASLNYSDQEISNVLDHRAVLAALELGRLRKENAELKALKDKASDSVKKVKKDVPKLQKPGKQRRAGSGIRRDNLAKLSARAKKSGSVKDAASVIEQLVDL